MKKQLPLQCLVFALTIFSLVSTGCASALQVVPEQSTHANTSPVSTQSQKETVAAIVKAQQANLRHKPSKSGSVVATVSKGDLLALINATPVGPWYRVRDVKSEAHGWVHGDTISLLQTTQASPVNTNSLQRPRRVSPPSSGRSYVNVDGVRVPSPVFTESKPAGATARCRDGSYSFSQHRRGTCSYHGGVAEWF